MRADAPLAAVGSAVVLYRTLELTVAPALRAVYRPTVTGLQHVPHTGPVIIG